MPFCRIKPLVKASVRGDCLAAPAQPDEAPQALRPFPEQNAIYGFMTTRPIRILGIDPGLRRTGWGIVEVEGNRLTFVGCGSVLSDDKEALAIRLLAIHDGLARVVDEFRPHEAAVEATFVNKDATATLKLGQARGIAMVVPAKAGVPVAEYAPNLVKKSIVGAGHGDKAQVRMMIGVLLPKADPASHDAADALAIAVTHAHHRQSLVLQARVQAKVKVAASKVVAR
jgi:crossover junction endodeoxyribonuclease RuvC